MHLQPQSYLKLIKYGIKLITRVSSNQRAQGKLPPKVHDLPVHEKGLGLRLAMELPPQRKNPDETLKLTLF